MLHSYFHSFCFVFYFSDGRVLDSTRLRFLGVLGGARSQRSSVGVVVVVGVLGFWRRYSGSVPGPCLELSSALTAVAAQV